VVARVLHVLSPVTAFPDASSILTYVFGLFCFCFFLFTVCLTGLFVGICARSTLFYLLIVLKYKEWLNVVHVMFVFCSGCCFKSNLFGLWCKESYTSILYNLPLNFLQ
jgi:hypothetical protein